MATDGRILGRLARLLEHPHFHDLKSWRIDMLVCFLVAAVMTPANADPNRFYYIAVPLFVGWMFVRFVISRRKLPDDVG
ncbi:MAG: hypothetical protein C0483_21390 [Pirellula sp.]|nr:hypothetical protein [Pirellula sp.]